MRVPPSNTVRLLASMLVLLFPVQTAGQRIAPRHTYTIDLPRSPTTPDSGRVLPRTYWLEGGVVGGTVLGVLAAASAHGVCEQDCAKSTVLVGALFGALGFTIGALVGGQFRK